MIKVNHANYGVLFAAMINGSGSLISKEDEEGNDLPFLTTEEILKQLEKFGFYIEYNVESNLPSNVIAYLSELYNLGYDKITQVYLESTSVSGSKVWRPTVIVMKSYQDNDDLLTFNCRLFRDKFYKKLEANSIINVTHEDNMEWSWLNYIANISDLLDENIDPVDEYQTETNIEDDDSAPQVEPEGYTVYVDSDDVSGEDE